MSPTPRNIAVDPYRGLVMLLTMAEVVQLSRVAESYPGNLFWRIAAFNQTHLEWAGMGQPFPRMLAHTIWRSLVLIALGISLRSTHSTQTNFTFEDTLTQIGLGYTFLFLLAFRSPRLQWTAFGLILFGYSLAPHADSRNNRARQLPWPENI